MRPFAFGEGSSRANNGMRVPRRAAKVAEMRTSVCAVCLAAASSLGANPWADQVISYNQGTGASADYLNSLTVLGSPERMTGENTPFGPFVGAVTPFNPVFGVDELVSIGSGGSITVRFDEPIFDDAANPFGADFLIFGNSGFIDDSFNDFSLALGTTTAEGSMFGRGANSLVEVSADGLSWFGVGGGVDRLFPTLGYLDITNPYELSPGATEADFTKPVNPATLTGGMSFGALVTAYDGSGGGASFDISSTGLISISYIRVSNLSTNGATLEIDAFSDVSAVPAPGFLSIGALALVANRRRRGA
jgi:hypothetical protein